MEQENAVEKDNAVQMENATQKAGVGTKKTALWIVLGIVVLAVLAGGAFMAMRLLNARVQTSSGGEGPGGLMRLSSAGGPSGGKSVSFKIKPAPELPQQAPDVRGMVTKAQDNSFFVSQVDNMMVRINKDGEQQTMATPTGPATEVVVSKDTKIYRDATMDNVSPENTSGSADNPAEIQQKLELTDVSAITANTNSFVQVWGQRRGDRLIADIIVVNGLMVKGGKK